MREWSNDIKVYELEEGFTLEIADRKEYARYYAVYVQQEDNIGFKKDFQQSLDVVSEDDFCFWIKKDGKRIGGAFLQPNSIEGLFLIPPYNDIYKALMMIKKALIFWSDRSKPIEANVVNESQVEVYEKLGFRIVGRGRWMLRPTEEFIVEWEDKFEKVLPSKEQTNEIGKLIHAAYVDDPFQHYSLEERTGFVEDYFTDNSHIDILNKASSVVYDKDTKELIGVCLISEYNEWPLVYDIVVKKEYRGKGIAEKMLQNSLTVLKKDYPVVRLYVDSGNPAETLYYNVGFFPGKKLTDLSIPADNI